jgi:hypothetical protein
MSWATLPRRKRQVAVAAAAGAAFVVLAAVGLRSGEAPAAYRPGEAIEGVTSALDRGLPDDYPRVAFTDVTERAGIHFRHFPGRRSSQLPEDMGSGAAWGDYDDDGWVDLFVANAVGPLTLEAGAVERSSARSALYHNEGDGTFTEAGAAAGIDHRGWAMGGAWADHDNDGDLDLVVTAWGRNAFFRNDGDGTFTEVGGEVGITGPEGFWTGAAWGDYDRDGFLDLYVSGYVRYEALAGEASGSAYDVENPASINPSSFPPERNLLYHNEGDGTFREVAEAAGVANPEGRSLSAAWADLDEDGWPDLYVANDVSDNVLYRNRGDGTFEDVSHAARVADYRGAMGIAVGDWDGDTDLDLFVTHWIAQENALYDNQRWPAPEGGGGPLVFMDEADRHGVGQLSLDDIGWGTAFFDYDNDGRLDIFAANGSTLQRREAPAQLVPMRSRLFWNGGAERGFYEVSPVAGSYFGQEYVGRGAAVADYDNDGDMDLIVVNHGGPPVLLRNEARRGERHWLQVELRGRQSNRGGIGAKLRLVAGGRVQVREVGAAGSYLSQHSPIEHFGLGAAALVDTLEIAWPSGVRQRLTGVGAGRRVRVEEAAEGEVGEAGEARSGSGR